MDAARMAQLVEVVVGSVRVIYFTRRQWGKPKSKASKAHAARKRVKDANMALEDRRWSVAVKVRARLQCEWDRCTVFRKGLASHHVFTRSLKSVRHYIPNGACLCSGHHFNAHKMPSKFKDMMIRQRGQEWFDDLQIKVNARHVVFK